MQFYNFEDINESWAFLDCQGNSCECQDTPTLSLPPVENVKKIVALNATFCCCKNIQVLVVRNTG